MSIDSPAASPADDPKNICVARKEGVTLFSHAQLDVLMQMPLPGITIFVHGVNSDGEWYEQAEQGLCEGLNNRLARRDQQLKHCGPEAGQLSPARYMAELTPNGFINPEMDARTFIQSDDTFSPVIRFRWGYKANGEELQEFGAGVYLNEENYWGGGPFANGCTSLPDLWGQGLSENMFLWVHVQHLNPTNDRQVYSCPPRPYYVLAAHRLAKLVESIRSKQADVPITIVCHSQGNMVGIAAAFLGDKLPNVTDAAGHTGRCVADTYVLCNPPYSLVKDNLADSWSERSMADPQGRTGRQTVNARTKTLAAFFDIIRKQASAQQPTEPINLRMSNKVHGFTAEADRAKYGLNNSTYGRVTLYCNPHDQVISSTTVQGIGWRGLNDAEITATYGDGVFTQRVFAQGFKVGEQGQYNYWRNHYLSTPEHPLKSDSADFWQPTSPYAKYSVAKGLEASQGWGRILSWPMTVLSAPLIIVALRVVKTRINALPPTDWTVPLRAPDLPEPFAPKSVRFGIASEQFDQGFDAPGEYRNRDRIHERMLAQDDPYTGSRTTEDGKRTDIPQGDGRGEAGLQQEHHAYLRMQAKREGRYKNDQKVEAEDKPDTANADYREWRSKKLKTLMADTLDTHATDHSTIMTNPMHAERALAYDVAIGNCDIREEDLHQLRIAADWRFVGGLKNGDAHKVFFEYFDTGYFRGESAYDWAHANCKMPDTITDEREWAPAPKWEGNA
jgi:pimeloyl-ACP methyl ester carboxylesterase